MTTTKYGSLVESAKQKRLNRKKFVMDSATLDFSMESLDNQINRPIIRSWVRGQNFLDTHYPGLKHRNWAKKAVPFDGISLERPLYG